jgi:hypothetical protein
MHIQQVSCQLITHPMHAAETSRLAARLHLNAVKINEGFKYGNPQGARPVMSLNI